MCCIEKELKEKEVEILKRESSAPTSGLLVDLTKLIILEHKIR
jgi:hypothetical protein